MELPLCQKYWISPLKQRCPILVRLFEQRDSVYVQKDPETVMTLLLNCLHIVYSSLLLPALHGEQKGVTCGCFACLPWFVGLFIFFCVVVVVVLLFFFCFILFCFLYMLCNCTPLLSLISRPAVPWILLPTILFDRCHFDKSTIIWDLHD